MAGVCWISVLVLPVIAAGIQVLAPAAESTSGPSCGDANRPAGDQDVLHVVYATDISQIEGLQASMSSVLASSANPRELNIHVLVQTASFDKFKKKFGVKPGCQDLTTPSGALIRFHPLDGHLSQSIHRSIPLVPKGVLASRGKLDAIENYARFYMHLVLGGGIAIYIDADTIVQADLGILRGKLLKSDKTVGFVARDPHAVGSNVATFVTGDPEACHAHFHDWATLSKATCYNAGILAVNVDRWRNLRVWEQVEHWVSVHNACNGTLWRGGSQPPLLLTFLDRARDRPADFVEFEPAWNTDGLGHRADLDVEELKGKFVLHWTGNQKPWQRNGMYRQLWKPHHEAFSKLTHLVA